MKKIFLLALTALTLTAVAMPYKVAFSKLPKRSQEFVERYFPAAKVISVELDRRSPSAEKYTVYFSDGNEVAFDGGSGDCSLIVMKSGSVPVDMLPAPMGEYLRANFPNEGVTMIERLNDGYRLQLANGTSLDFNKDGRRAEDVGTE